MPKSVVGMLIEARHLLGIASQSELGQSLGSSGRTGQRWESNRAVPTNQQLGQLAVRVYPKSVTLARELAAAAGTTPEALGLGTAAPAAPRSPSEAQPAPPPPFDPEFAVDTVVCAAADALQVAPDAVRPALRAAFRRARLAGLSVDVIDTALSGRPPTKAGGKPGR